MRDSNNTFSFNSSLIKSFLPMNGEQSIKQDGKNITYHYTSPEAFLSIVQNQSVRFTDVRFLNDKTEGIYFVKALLDFLDKNQGRYPYFELAVNELLKENDYKKIRDLETLEILYSEIPQMPYKPVRAFVFCTSTEPDSLNMWNYYVKNGSYQGYNIGIRIESFLEYVGKMLPNSDTTSIHYGKVLYNLKKQEEEVEALLETMESSMDNSVGVQTSREIAMWYLKRYIDLYGVFYKHPKFEGEKEYRFVIEAEEDGYKLPFDLGEGRSFKKSITKDFCIKNGIVAPFLTVPFGDDTISRVYISPMTEFDIAKRSIKELIYKNNYRVFAVYQSKIPIRY